MSQWRWGAILSIAASLACQNEPGTAVRIPVESTTPDFAKVGDTHSRGNLVWSEVAVVNGISVTAGIRGDGRNRQGQFAGILNEYQDSFCGAQALIYDQRGESGSLNSHPNVLYDTATMSAACGQPRQLAFYLGDGTTISTSATWVGANVVFDGIWTLAPGQSRVQPMIVGMQLVTCQLRYDVVWGGADNIRITRLPDASVTDATGRLVVARQWRAESQGQHRAACLLPPTVPNGKYTDTGKRYFLPFSVLLTQVPFPFPSYP